MKGTAEVGAVGVEGIAGDNGPTATMAVSESEGAAVATGGLIMSELGAGDGESGSVKRTLVVDGAAVVLSAIVGKVLSSRLLGEVEGLQCRVPRGRPLDS